MKHLQQTWIHSIPASSDANLGGAGGGGATDKAFNVEKRAEHQTLVALKTEKTAYYIRPKKENSFDH
jgi:hypothetical protein